MSLLGWLGRKKNDAQMDNDRSQTIFSLCVTSAAAILQGVPLFMELLLPPEVTIHTDLQLVGGNAM